MAEYEIRYVPTIPPGADYPRRFLADYPYDDQGDAFTFQRNLAGETDWIRIPKEIVRSIATSQS